MHRPLGVAGASFQSGLKAQGAYPGEFARGVSGSKIPDYWAAAVSTPDRKTLWLLGRTPTMDKVLYDHWTRAFG